MEAWYSVPGCGGHPPPPDHVPPGPAVARSVGSHSERFCMGRQEPHTKLVWGRHFRGPERAEIDAMGAGGHPRCGKGSTTPHQPPRLQLGGEELREIRSRNMGRNRKGVSFEVLAS